MDRWRFVWLGELVVLADAAVLAGDEARAEWLGAALRPHGDRFATVGTAVALGSVWRPIAAISGLAGRDDEADRHYRRAVAANLRVGARLWADRSRLGYARLLHRMGRTSEAGAMVDSVVAAAERSGLRRLLAEARLVGSEVGAGVAAPRVPGLTARESELLAAVAEGCSNRQLADRFHVSVKTIERHLSNIYTKLGAGGRDEAVRIARQRRSRVE